MRKLREDLRSEVKQAREKGQAELEGVEEKYEKLKKSTKEREMAQQKTISTLEKDLAISREKITNLAEKVKLFEEKQSSESERYSGEISDLKAALLKEKEQSRDRLEAESKEREKLEAEKNTAIANYQHEIALLSNKNKFLEEGKERYKA